MSMETLSKSMEACALTRAARKREVHHKGKSNEQRLCSLKLTTDAPHDEGSDFSRCSFVLRGVVNVVGNLTSDGSMDFEDFRVETGKGTREFSVRELVG